MRSPTALSAFALATALTLAAATPAKADDFLFSFTNTIGSVTGTVTGIITGLTDNSTSAATSVVITSFPAGLNSVLGNAPIDATLWDQQYQNSFTELNGQVTDGGFWAQQSNNSFGAGAQLYVNGSNSYNFLNLDGTDQLYVWGNDGIAAANIVPATDTPEPASLALLAAGLSALGLARRKRA